MRLEWGYCASSLVATGAAAAISAAPIAAADPVWPYAGAESAADTIRDLEDQGYTVAINWVNGYSTHPLSECSVSAINNPDRSPEPSQRSPRPSTSTSPARRIMTGTRAGASESVLACRGVGGAPDCRIREPQSRSAYSHGTIAGLGRCEGDVMLSADPLGPNRANPTC